MLIINWVVQKKKNNITYLQITDELGNVIFNNTKIGDNAGKNLLINSGSAIKIFAGGTYNFTVNNSFNNGNGCAALGIWIDADINGSLKGAENILDPKSSNISLCQATYAVKIPCNLKKGSSFLRLRVGPAGYFDTSKGCGNLNMEGNIIDLEIIQDYNNAIKNTFSYSSPNYIYQNVDFSIDTPQIGHTYLWWFDVIKKGHKGSKVKQPYPASGTYDIMVRDYYCNAADSWVQTIDIINPNTIPTAYFTGPKTGKVNEILIFKDSSIHGAYRFYWEFTAPSGAVTTLNNKECAFEPQETGTYKVCLTSENSNGPSSQYCNNNYLVVYPSANWVWNGQDKHITGQSKSTIDYLLLKPCKAKYLEIKLKHLNLKSTDVILVYDGVDQASPQIATIDYSNQLKFKDSVLNSKTGSFYIVSQSGSRICNCDMDTILSFRYFGIRDSTPPTLEIFGADTMYFPVGTAMKDGWNEISYTTYKAHSKYAGDLTSSVIISSNVDYTKKGVYYIDFEVHECDALKVTKRRVIIVDKFSNGYFAKAKLRAYFDADSSGNFNTGDIPLAEREFMDSMNYRHVYSNDSGFALYYPSQKYVSFKLVANKEWKYFLPSNGIRNWNYLSGPDTLDFGVKLNTKLPNNDIRLLSKLNAETAVKGINNLQYFLLDNHSLNTIDSVDVYIKLDRKYKCTFYETQPYFSSDSLYKLRYYNITPLAMKRLKWDLYVGEKETGFFNQIVTVILPGVQKDADTSNNRIQTRKKIIFPYDPNYKSVFPTDEMQNPGELLNYHIHFQNEGTAQARNVILRDTLASTLDANTFKFISSSFPCEVKRINNMLEFEFININLRPKAVNEAASHGWVQFQVNASKVLPVLKAVQNKASIYFDWEDPIHTNHATVIYAPVPKIQLKGNSLQRISVCSVYKELGAIARDTADGNISDKIKIKGSINAQSLKTDTLVYSITNSAGKSAQVLRLVEKYDSIKPHIYFNGKALTSGLKVQIPVFSNYKVPVSAADSCMGTIAVSGIPVAGKNLDLNKIGQYEITYQAVDIAGNAAVENGNSVFFEVKDTISPEIDLNTADTICVELNSPYISVKPTVKDNYSKSGSISLTVVNEVNTAMAGMYTETFTATDESGNTSRKIRMVQVGNCLSNTQSQKERNEILIFPNPAANYLTILHSKSLAQNLVYQITDISGRIMLFGHVQSDGSEQVKLDSLTSGIYMISVYFNNQVINQKICVQH